MPQLANDCIASWHKYMPDWEYKLWNEDNFDVNRVPYVKEAYEARKYAFVSDYVRLHALLTEGGVYMDTDVEVIKPYDESLMSLTGFIGFEGSKSLPIGTGIIASIPNNEWVKNQLALYDNAHFLKEDGTYDMTPNTLRISNAMKFKGFLPNGEYQFLEGMHIFPVDYFCPRQTTGELFITENTFCDHHFMCSWTEGKKKKHLILRIAGPQISIKLIKLKRLILG